LKPRREATLKRFLGLPARRPLATLVFAGLVVLLATASISRLQPASSLQSMMDQNEPSAVAFGKILSNCESMDRLLLVVSLPKGSDGDRRMLGEFAARLEQSIAADAEFSDWIGEVRYSRGARPEDRAFVEQRVIPAGLYYMSERQFAALLQRLTLQSMQEQVRRNEELIAAPGPAADALSRILQNDPLRLRDFLREVLAKRVGTNWLGPDDLLLSKDQQSLLIAITVRRPATDLDFTKRFLIRIQFVAERINSDDLQLGWSGAYAIAAASERAIRTDMIRSVVAAVLLMQAMFLIVYRRLWTFVLAFLPTAAAIIVAFGIHAAFKSQLMPATAVVGAVIAGLGIDFSIHLISHFAHARRSGVTPVEAAQCAATELFVPTVAAAGTTFIGVIAITRSHVGALRDFSSVALLGLVGSMIAAFTILPALLIVAHRFSIGSGNETKHFEARFTLNGVVVWILRRARRILLIAAAIWIVIIGYVLMQDAILPIEHDLTVMHPRPNPALELQEHIVQEFDIAANTLLVHVCAGSADALVTAAHQVEYALQSEDVRSAGVRGVVGLSTLLPDPRTISAREELISQIHVDQVLTDLRTAIDDSMFERAAFGEVEEFLRGFLGAAKPPGLASLREYAGLVAAVLPKEPDVFESICVIQLAHPLAERAQRDHAITVIRDALRDLPDATLTGLSVISHDVERSITADLARLSGLAAAAVIIFLALFIRNPFHLVLALTPTAFGLTCVLAGFHWWNDGLNMINLVGVPLLMGVGDNFGIFVIDVLRKHRHGTLSADEVVPHLAASARAITLTGVTAILGFGSLMFTSTPAIQSLGRLTALGVTASLAGTFFIVMPVTLWLVRATENRP
jgi:uncharacterized protein